VPVRWKVVSVGQKPRLVVSGRMARDLRRKRTTVLSCSLDLGLSSEVLVGAEDLGVENRKGVEGRGGQVTLKDG
jgi:hypothetical protein